MIMESQEFIKQLFEIQELMKEEKYTEALILLSKLKEIEKKGDFDYNLTHKLYQLDSNCRSLFNQDKILKQIDIFAQNQNSISFQELKESLKTELNLDDGMLRREIELLILRGLLNCKIEGNELKL